ncbi:MAG TPA: hypothetical protein VEU11_20010 [Terriglobales bacterium]|nr:hypothetical protein [Terriglobales bacterium]
MMVNLPWGFNLSVNSLFISRTPVLPVDPSLFIHGTVPAGAAAPPPALSHYTLSKSDLESAVAGFNFEVRRHERS